MNLYCLVPDAANQDCVDSDLLFCGKKTERRMDIDISAAMMPSASKSGISYNPEISILIPFIVPHCKPFQFKYMFKIEL